MGAAPSLRAELMGDYSDPGSTGTNLHMRYLMRCMSPHLADIVAKGFWASE